MTDRGTQKVLHGGSKKFTIPSLNDVQKSGKLLDIIGSHPRMLEVYKQILLWAPTTANILILGETGTGKELVARAIHTISPRSDKAFVVLDCSCLSRELVESELFGHEKGAFTGASSLHIGRFERANHGTLFLDEISNISYDVQSKLLRVLENRTFERVGGNREIQVDVRVITASNQSLYTCIDQETFRKDLLYRLNTCVIELPALRERISDLPLLTNAFLDKFKKKYTREFIRGFTIEALSAMSNYSWPGNVRELLHVVERCVLLAEGSFITIEMLPKYIVDPTQPRDNLCQRASNYNPKAQHEAVPQVISNKQNEFHCTINSLTKDFFMHSPFENTPPPGISRYDHEINTYEKYIITYALKMNDGDVNRTAVFLGLTKTDLRKKMNTLGLELNNK